MRVCGCLLLVSGLCIQTCVTVYDPKGSSMAEAYKVPCVWGGWINEPSKLRCSFYHHEKFFNLRECAVMFCQDELLYIGVLTHV